MSSCHHHTSACTVPMSCHTVQTSPIMSSRSFYAPFNDIERGTDAKESICGSAVAIKTGTDPKNILLHTNSHKNGANNSHESRAVPFGRRQHVREVEEWSKINT